jgi:hypothetical protein
MNLSLNNVTHVRLIPIGHSGRDFWWASISHRACLAHREHVLTVTETTKEEASFNAHDPPGFSNVTKETRLIYKQATSHSCHPNP